MNQITEALTKKYGPLPGYAWAGIAALAAWLIVPRLSGMFGSSSSSSSSNALAPGAPAATVDSSGQPIYYQPGAPNYYYPPGQGPGSSLAASPAAATPAGALPRTGPALTGQPCPPGMAGPGVPYCHPAGASDFGGKILPSNYTGIGGPSRTRSIGNRRAQLMSAHHPDLKTPVRYTQTLAAIGGPSNHVASVHAIAKRAGVHPARLLALNSVYSGVIRIH